MKDPLACYGREEYTDENSKSRGEIDLDLIEAVSRQNIHILRIMSVRD